MNGNTESTGDKSLLTVRQLASKHPAWTEAAIRKLIFLARERHDSRGNKIPSNGLDTAIVRCGGRVLLDEQKFLEWVPSYTLQGRA